ncbi:MAG: Ig-like domain-containing protein [Flavisolibacter sp.]
MRKAQGIGLIIIIIISFLVYAPGCANIIPPTGGAKDTLPPILVKASIPDSSVNFRGKSISFEFDEYLADPQNPTANIIFTPTFEHNPTLVLRAKTLTVKFNDSLEKNTTYVLNFGDAIADANETNVLHGFHYTFSTGPALDSLELSGRVILAETGGIDTTLIAVLHKNLNDSAVQNKRPLYAVKLDGTGRFRFRNLPADTFALYVIGDAGMLKRYNQKTQLFAFADRHVVAGSNDSLLLYAYQEQKKPANIPPLTGALKASGSDRRIRMSLPTAAQHDIREDYLISFGVPLRTLDSTKIHLSTDSAFIPSLFTARLDSSNKQLRIVSAWKENTRYNLVLEKEFATDTLGKQLLKSDTVFFTTTKVSDYGNVLIRFHNLDLSKNPVLQLVINNQVVDTIPLKSDTFRRTMFTPGEYSLRILYDTNGNGRWDPGQFFNAHKQPEIVRALPQTITVKANWDNEFDIQL